MNRSKLIKCILSTIPILATIMYGGGYIAQLFGNYSLWQKNGGSMGDGTAPQFPSANVKVCLNSLFSFPYGLIGIAVCIGAMAVLILLIMKMGAGERTELDRERNFEYSSKGTYGTSGFMSEKEMYEIFDVDSVKNNTGILLGEYKNKAIFLPKESYMNKNIAVFGASGSMKSRAFVRNYIFQATRRGESLVITDPKSEMYEDMAVYLENQGYEVKVFNLVSPQNSDSWNCIADINGDDLMAQTFTDVVIKNTTVGMGDEFWDSASVNLLKALVLYVSVEFEGEDCNFGEAYKLISIHSAAELDALFSVLDYKHPAFAPYNIFKQASDNVRSGIIIGLGARLQVFQNEMIRNITKYNEINLVEAGKRKCAYFCITSDQDSTFDFLASLFFSFLFIRLVRFADNYGENGKLPVPVNFVLSEYRNEIVNMDGFGEKSYQKMIDSIEKSRSVPFNKFLRAIDIPMIGRYASKTISDRFDGCIEKFEEALFADEPFDFTQLDKIGDTMCQSIYDWFDNEENRSLWNKLKEKMNFIIKNNEEETIMSKTLEGKTIVVTGTVEGYTRNEMNALIASHGGISGDSVTKKTDILVIAEKPGASKVNKAAQLGTKTMTADEFKLMLGVTGSNE